MKRYERKLTWKMKTKRYLTWIWRLLYIHFLISLIKIKLEKLSRSEEVFGNEVRSDNLVKTLRKIKKTNY